MTEPAITPELVAKHNLTPDEFAQAKEILGNNGCQWFFAAFKGESVTRLDLRI